MAFDKSAAWKGFSVALGVILAVTLVEVIETALMKARK